MHKKMFFTGCVLAALSVALGAIGAHLLEKQLSEKMLKAFETAARYQMYHAIAIVLCGVLYQQSQIKQIITSYKLFFFGTLLFSGSLYLLSLLSIGGSNNFGFIGAITPLGGICLILGWIFLALGLSKMK